MSEDIVDHNVEVLTSEEMGEIRSDPDRSKQVPVEIDSRVDRSHNGFYLVTGFQYNQHGRVTCVRGADEEKRNEDGRYDSVQVVYSDGEKGAVIGLGVEPNTGELPEQYYKRCKRQENVFSGPQEAVDALEQTEQETVKSPWDDIELE